MTLTPDEAERKRRMDKALATWSACIVQRRARNAYFPYIDWAVHSRVWLVRVVARWLDRTLEAAAFRWAIWRVALKERWYRVDKWSWGWR